MPLRSIRLSMTGGFSVSIALLMAFACFGLIWFSRHTADENADRILDTAAKQMRSELAAAKTADEFKRLIDEEREEFDVDDITLVVVSGGGKAFADSKQTDIQRLLLAGEGWHARTVSVGGATIKIGVSWKRTERDLRYHASALLVLGAIVVAIAAVGAWILVGRTLFPIAALSRQATAASADSLGVHLDEPSADSEIVELVATLNGLLARVSETAGAKARFYSAASHELRTPLQALSGHLELALNKERTGQDYKLVVEEAYRQTRRLSVLVQDLLLLYQLETDAPQPPVEPGDLTLVCRRALSLCQSIIDRRGLRVETVLPEQADFYAPPAHVDILVRNLLENAAKYADQGSVLALDLHAVSGGLQLMVFNTCSQILVSDTQDGSLSVRHNDGGTGLGLSICRAIANANGWELTVEQEASGVRATLTMQDVAGDRLGEDS